MKLGRDLRWHNCRDVPGGFEGGGWGTGGTMELLTLTVVCQGDARPLMPSSSLTAAARSQYLLDLLARLPDPRKRRGRRHSLAGLLAVGIAAVTAGSRSFAAIGQWAADAGAGVLARLGAVRGPAEESTFRRAFALISADVPGG
jgi:DDE_Tnp_1-associated